MSIQDTIVLVRAVNRDRAGISPSISDIPRIVPPADPGLHPPGTVPATGEQVCSLLPLGAARAVVASVTTVQPDDPGGAVACRYGFPGGRLGFSVLSAPDPRSWYEDDQWAPAVAGGRAFLMEGSPGEPPRSAWVESSAGPVQIVDNSENPGMGPDGLLALAQRMASASVDRLGRPKAGQAAAPSAYGAPSKLLD